MLFSFAVPSRTNSPTKNNTKSIKPFLISSSVSTRLHSIKYWSYFKVLQCTVNISKAQKFWTFFSDFVFVRIFFSSDTDFDSSKKCRKKCSYNTDCALRKLDTSMHVECTRLSILAPQELLKKRRNACILLKPFLVLNKQILGQLLVLLSSKSSKNHT